MLRYKGYTADPVYSEEDHIYYGVLLGISDHVDIIADTEADLEREFRSAVDDYLIICKEIGKTPLIPKT